MTERDRMPDDGTKSAAKVYGTDSAAPTSSATPTATTPTQGKIGVYDAPERSGGGPSMLMIIAIVAVIAVVAYLLFQFVF